ncbi:MAG: hypothetical protein ACK2UW_03685 [Anaerolineales bacterium]
MIVPHIIDQFVWDQINADLGAGPQGIKISKLSSQNLEPKILDLVNNEAYKQHAEQLAVQMGKEDFREEIYRTIIGS